MNVLVITRGDIKEIMKLVEVKAVRMLQVET
jgi:hypothetical protein